MLKHVLGGVIFLGIMALGIFIINSFRSVASESNIVPIPSGDMQGNTSEMMVLLSSPPRSPPAPPLPSTRQPPPPPPPPPSPSPPKPVFNGIIHNGKSLMYSASDKLWLNESSKIQREVVPRVLIYTWCTEEACSKFVNEVYWKACYAHAHGFDIVFTSEKKILPWNWPMFKHLGYTEDETNLWEWVTGVQDYLSSGKYDYVFLMKPDVLIQESNFDFPVWAFDRGHDITIMDQYHFLWPEAQLGLDANNILFRSSALSKQFLAELFKHHNGFSVLTDGGPYMETILTFLGREAQKRRRPGYESKCELYMRLRRTYTASMENDPEMAEAHTEQFTRCFFVELERLVGYYGYRRTKGGPIGFSPVFVTHNGKKLIPEQVRKALSTLSRKLGRGKKKKAEKPQALAPWANCWQNVRKWWPNTENNCFALRWNDQYMRGPTENGHVQGQCPDKTFNWEASPYNPVNIPTFDNPAWIWHVLTHNQNLYAASDLARYEATFNISRLPRVLIYTWCTEDSYTKYVNEVYWKSCYANAHGYDIIFSSAKNVSGVMRPSEEEVWAWVPDIQKYLFSGEYDYVFVMRFEVLIQNINLDFPVWAWDKGHSITLMDQHHFGPPNSYGLDENSILFKPSELTAQFLEELFRYRTGFHLQGDNGPFMETILEFMGRDAKAQGLEGYNHSCLDLMKLGEPSADVQRSKESLWASLNDKYSECFFTNFDRLAGAFGSRTSKSVGFSPTFMMQDSVQLLPANANGALGPWANCWSGPRGLWSFPEKNCFAIHWRGSADTFKRPEQVDGNCPDPSFNWGTSPYNPANRG